MLGKYELRLANICLILKIILQSVKIIYGYAGKNFLCQIFYMKSMF